MPGSNQLTPEWRDWIIESLACGCAPQALVEGGGATIFPELGLEVAPQPGSAVYFEYCNRRGQLDPLTLHGGAPVSAGEKWITTKWVRQRRYG